MWTPRRQFAVQTKARIAGLATAQQIRALMDKLLHSLLPRALRVQSA
jgi:hypothetical protein